MLLDQESVKEFKELYSQSGVVLTDEQAHNLGSNLVVFVGAVYGVDNLPDIKDVDNEAK